MSWYSPWGYQMWDCGACGCLAIAASLTACPHCGKEREVPKTTSGGSSNAAAVAETKAVEDAEAEAAKAAEEETKPAAKASRTPKKAADG